MTLSLHANKTFHARRDFSYGFSDETIDFALFKLGIKSSKTLGIQNVSAKSKKDLTAKRQKVTAGAKGQNISFQFIKLKNSSSNYNPTLHFF